MLGQGRGPGGKAAARGEPRGREEWILDLRAAASQLLMIGIGGEMPSTAACEMVSSPPVGGVILFARNVSSPGGVARLTHHLQRLALSGGGPGLLVAVDQEGGLVSRLPGDLDLMPPAMALGAAGDPDLARATGREVGSRLLALGVNVNMAPVLDVNTQPLNPVIGLRSFGDGPGLVSSMGVAYIRGLQGSGVMAVAKHFPGHGHTDLDSHHHLPSVSLDREQLREVHLAPFGAAVSAGVQAVMTAHVAYPSLDPSGLPATLSGSIVTGILRREMGFEGLVFTDDLEMGAIVTRTGPDLGAVEAIAAGCDMVLVCHRLDRQLAVRDSIVRAVEEGRLAMAAVKRALARVLAAKETLGLTARGVAARPAPAPGQGLGDVCAAIARKAVRVGADPGHLLPLPSGSRVTVIVPGSSLRGGTSPLAEALAPRLRPTVKTWEAGDVGLAPGTDLLVLGVVDLSRRREGARAVSELIGAGTPAVVLGLGAPYDLRVLPPGTTYVAVFGQAPCLQEAAARLLLDEEGIEG